MTFQDPPIQPETGRPRREPRRCPLRWLVVAALLLAQAASPHENPDAPVPGVAAVPTQGVMVVDGVLDESFWADCPVATGLIDQRTGAAALDQTRVRVAYTDAHLCIGVECLDGNMAAIHATERREDRAFVGDDWVEIHFDPPHNHRGKYAFFTNPLGTRADANEGPSGAFNYGWTATWECAARMGEDRWTFEMRIPLGVLNYFRKDGQRWGFNITRLQRSTDVTSFWSFSPTDIYKPRQFGHLTAMDLAGTHFDRNWEVSPYASARARFGDGIDTRYDAGLDLKFRLTPAIITSWTVNPDFGQIEADDDTIELRDTERFLTERRPYFAEGEELMRMPHALYYSRRFTDPDAGAKVSGQQPGFNFNVQNIQGLIQHGGPFHGNSTVVRVNQDIGERSTLGYYAAASILDEGEATSGSVDGYLFLTDAWRVSYQASIVDEDLHDAAGTPVRGGVDYLGAASLLYELYPWRLGLTYTAITDGFNPLLGYIPRHDIFGPSLHAEYLLRAGTGWYKEFLAMYDPRIQSDGGGSQAIHDHGLYTGLLLRNDLRLRATYDHQEHRPYENWRTSAGVDLFASDFYRGLGLTWATGEFEKTVYQELLAGKRIKFIERLPIRLDANVRFEDRPSGESAIVWLGRVVFDLYITDTQWVKASLQFRDSAVRNLSVIHGWRLRRTTWWYLVFNEIRDRAGENTSAMTKVVYTF